MLLLPPARSDGLSFDAGRPAGEAVAAAAVIGFLILALPASRARPLGADLSCCDRRARWRGWHAQIGGQTGDVMGALEQASEIAILLVALG